MHLKCYVQLNESFCAEIFSAATLQQVALFACGFKVCLPYQALPQDEKMPYKITYHHVETRCFHTHKKGFCDALLCHNTVGLGNKNVTDQSNEIMHLRPGYYLLIYRRHGASCVAQRTTRDQKLGQASSWMKQLLLWENQHARDEASLQSEITNNGRYTHTKAAHMAEGGTP